MPQIKISGVEHTIDADPQMPLLWAIRDLVGPSASAGLTVMSSIGTEECGARGPTVRFLPVLTQIYSSLNPSRPNY